MPISSLGHVCTFSRRIEIFQKQSLFALFLTIICLLILSGSVRPAAALPTVGECWDSLTGTYEGSLTGSASAGGESDGMSMAGHDLEIKGDWVFAVGDDGSLLIFMGGGLNTNIPVLMGQGLVDMTTG